MFDSVSVPCLKVATGDVGGVWVVVFEPGEVVGDLSVVVNRPVLSSAEVLDMKEVYLV